MIGKLQPFLLRSQGSHWGEKAKIHNELLLKPFRKAKWKVLYILFLFVFSFIHIMSWMLLSSHFTVLQIRKLRPRERLSNLPKITKLVQDYCWNSNLDFSDSNVHIFKFCWLKDSIFLHSSYSFYISS